MKNDPQAAARRGVPRKRVVERVIELLEDRRLMSVTVVVPATSNVFGAGQTTPPGGGTAPPGYAFASAVPGTVLTFAGVSGSVSVNVGTGSDYNDADGVGSAGRPLSIDAASGISGISHDQDGFLVGVFLGPTVPAGTAPPSLAFSSNGTPGTIRTNFASLAPKLDQTFFVGDGRTGDGTGAAQTFVVPAGATRLYLGFADGGNYSGAPGFYFDDQGALQATFSVTPPGGAIAGLVFADANLDGTRQSTEPGLGGVKVYIDANDNGVPDAGEVSATTNSTGHYTLPQIQPGTYRLREVAPAGYQLDNPAGGFLNVTVAGTLTTTGQRFADAPATASILGRVFNDVNADGLADGGEAGLGLVSVYLDLNHDGTLDAGDVTTTTNVTGHFQFAGLTAGTYAVRVAPVPGLATTAPSGGTITVKLAAAQAASGVRFGLRATS